jgi:hypothetical protein
MKLKPKFPADEELLTASPIILVDDDYEPERAPEKKRLRVSKGKRGRND